MHFLLNLRALFSMRPARGNNTRNKRKYRAEAPWPIRMKGCSTGMPPIHVKMSMSATSVQNSSWLKGRNIKLRCFDVWVNGRIISTRIDRSSARTPPSLLGIDRRMA